MTMNDTQGSHSKRGLTTSSSVVLTSGKSKSDSSTSQDEIIFFLYNNNNNIMYLKANRASKEMFVNIFTSMIYNIVLLITEDH